MIKPTELVARFVNKIDFGDIPENAVQNAVEAITDCVGVALAGSQEPVALKLGELINYQKDFNAQANLFGSNEKADWCNAALYNGCLSHAIDYDDTSQPAYSHISSHIVPVLFSLGRYANASGSDLITAYIASLEVEAKLGRVMNIEHYAKGWHSTSTFGSLGGAVAGSKLLDFDIDHIKMALGISASSACGLRANFGTMTKPLNAGFAARNGVLATMLAKNDISAAADILENPFGFINTFSAKSKNNFEAFEHLGKPLEITTENGICLKPFPSCGSTHAAIEGAIRISKEIDTTDAIEEIIIGVNELTPKVLIHNEPKDTLQAKFSMQFCVAAALVKKEINLKTFNKKVLYDKEIQVLMKKVKMCVDDRVRNNKQSGSVICIKCSSGRIYEQIVAVAKGKPMRRLSKEELQNKFIDCSEPVLGLRKAKIAFKSLQKLYEMDSIENIIKLITP